MEKQKSFRIGLAMAGAVSAGAYTAGVTDYLLEALESWQELKDLGFQGVPQHDVVIEALSGSSAGGMTAVVTAAALQQNFPHINQRNCHTDACKKNPLFDAWVNMTEEAENDVMHQLLDLSDILNSPSSAATREVRSVFNADFVETIASRILLNTVTRPEVRRPYVAGDLELLTTLTNLRGYDYQLEFQTATGVREERMTSHKDLLHFQLNTTGIYRNDGKIPFHFNDDAGLHKELLADAAIATGAYPAGLRPREILRKAKYINDNRLLRLSGENGNLVDPSIDYAAVCMDGGVINNEPYDLTEAILVGRKKEEIRLASGRMAAENFIPERSPSSFDMAVLMIDPFPGYAEPSEENFSVSQGLKKTVLRLIKAMQQQVAVKTELLDPAYDDSNFTRFMVSPVRSKEGLKQKNALASGALGGFAGFFCRKFREHDYMLGRRNCQRFLQEYFCVPVSASNPVIYTGYKHFTEQQLKLYLTADQRSLPIIPDIRLSRDHTTVVRPAVEEEFSYPSISTKYVMNLEKKVLARFGIVFKYLTAGQITDNSSWKVHPGEKPGRKGSWISTVVLEPARRFLARRLVSLGIRLGKQMVARKFIEVVIAGMDSHGLLKSEH